MNRKLLTGAIVAGVVLFTLAYFVSPVLAVRALTEAAQTGDEAALTRLVDFPAFRSSVKDELNTQLVAGMRADPRASDPVLSGLGMLLAPALVSGMVDAFVTPGAIATMVRTADAPDPMHKESAKPPAVPEAGDGDAVRQSWGYRDLNTFALTLSREDRPEQHLSLLMQRRGLFNWKLTGLDLTAPSEDDPI